MTYSGLKLKVVLKLYEFTLQLLRPVNINYFCRQFESLPRSSVQFTDSILHILIPYRDRWSDTEKCLNAIVLQNRTGIKCYVHLIDNGSSLDTKASVAAWIKQAQFPDLHFSMYADHQEFNFSRLCNIALDLPLEDSSKEYVLFLNNDVILEDRQTLHAATNFSRQTPTCGVVGITLLYPNRRIQHIFAAPGVKIVAGHPFKGRPASLLEDWNKYARQVPAVTGAFMLLSLANFKLVDGFDERLATTGQDIDLCLKLQQKGLRNWALPFLQATHVEGASRGRKSINKSEVEYIYLKWSDFLTHNPGYPQIISRWSEQPVLAWGEGVYPYRKILDSHR